MLFASPADSVTTRFGAATSVLVTRHEPAIHTAKTVGLHSCLEPVGSQILKSPYHPQRVHCAKDYSVSTVVAERVTNSSLHLLILRSTDTRFSKLFRASPTGNKRSRRAMAQEFLDPVDAPCDVSDEARGSQDERRRSPFSQRRHAALSTFYLLPSSILDPGTQSKSNLPRAHQQKGSFPIWPPMAVDLFRPRAGSDPTSRSRSVVVTIVLSSSRLLPFIGRQNTCVCQLRLSTT